MIRKLLCNKQAIVGLALIAVISLTAVMAPLIVPNDPNKIDLVNKFAPASRSFPLGADQLGRCVLSRIILGARYSLGIAVPTLLVMGAMGIITGMIAAYIGGYLERIFIILCDIFMAFPPLIIVMSLVGAMGQKITIVLIAVIFSMWVWYAKVVQTNVGIEKTKDYIIASRIAGCSEVRIIFFHIFPNILPQYIVYLSTGVASLILMLSSFSFLGLGIPAGIPEWGAMLGEAKSHFYSHPMLVVYPGLCILLTAAGFNIFGEALRDIISPGEVS